MYQPIHGDPPARRDRQPRRTAATATIAQPFHTSAFLREFRLFLVLAALVLLAWKVGPWAQGGLAVPMLSGFNAMDSALTGGGNAATTNSAGARANGLAPLPA